MKTYIKPEIEIYNVVMEQLLSESGGQGNRWDAPKRHDYNNNSWVNEADKDDESATYDSWE